jgi:hypothetical protein
MPTKWTSDMDEKFPTLPRTSPIDRNAPIKPNEREALERLIGIAQGYTGQSRRVADFLLSWWNASECGAFDITTMWGVDEAIGNDMVTVFGFIARVSQYPDTLGYKEQFQVIVRNWRPELKD